MMKRWRLSLRRGHAAASTVARELSIRTGCPQRGMARSLAQATLAGPLARTCSRCKSWPAW